MSGNSSFLPKAARNAIRIAATVLLNLGIVFSGVYILFHILDKYNPHGFINSNLPWLPVVIAAFFLLSVLLYDLLLFDGAFQKRRFHKERMWLIILCDLILFAALSITVYLKTCVCAQQYQAHQLATPVPVKPTSSSAPSIIVDEPVDPNTPIETVSPIPGLLGNKYAEKFSEMPSEQSFEIAETVETLEDGIEKALIYTYSSSNAAVDIYHYQDGKLEYQVADIYIRDIRCFTTDYELRAGNDLKTQGYAERIDAIVAVNGDNFNSGRMEDGVVVRNGAQLFPLNGEKQTSFSRDLCVLTYDGTMRVYDCALERIDYDELLSQYPVHIFNFGPKLLNDDGSPKQRFNSNLGKSNPRTALGYYEPGHYALIVILGERDVIDYEGKNHGQSKSPGMTLIELSELCHDLGFAMAYNLDGGGTASMAWDHAVFGNNDRSHGDVLAIVEP